MKITHTQLLNILKRPHLKELEILLDKAVEEAWKNKKDDDRAADKAIVSTLKKNGWTVAGYRNAGGCWQFVAGSRARLLQRTKLLIPK